MLRLLILLAFSVFATTGFAQESPKPREDESKKGPQAFVYPDRCVFHFPVIHDGKNWNCDSPVGHLSYSWMVKIKGVRNDYELGLSNFSLNTIKDATLKDLVAMGQTDIWKLVDDGAESVDDKSITCSAQDGSLRIIVKGKKWHQELFGAKPKIVKFCEHGAMLKRREHSVKVIYKEQRKSPTR